jgi:hypothetical protein
VVDLASNNMVPHVDARETHQRPLEFSILTRKRLLQQYLPLAEVALIRSSSPRASTWLR